MERMNIPQLTELRRYSLHLKYAEHHYLSFVARQIIVQQIQNIIDTHTLLNGKKLRKHDIMDEKDVGFLLKRFIINTMHHNVNYIDGEPLVNDAQKYFLDKLMLLLETKGDPSKLKEFISSMKAAQEELDLKEKNDTKDERKKQDNKNTSEIIWKITKNNVKYHAFKDSVQLCTGDLKISKENDKIIEGTEIMLNKEKACKRCLKKLNIAY